MGEVAQGGGHRWKIAGWSLAGAILILPALGMLVTEEMNWGPGDFLAAAALLGGLGLGLELVLRRARGTAGRLAAGAALLGAFLLVWAELAVGIFS